MEFLSSFVQSYWRGRHHLCMIISLLPSCGACRLAQCLSPWDWHRRWNSSPILFVLHFYVAERIKGRYQCYMIISRLISQQVLSAFKCGSWLPLWRAVILHSTAIERLKLVGYNWSQLLGRLQIQLGQSIWFLFIDFVFIISFLLLWVIGKTVLLKGV